MHDPLQEQGFQNCALASPALRAVPTRITRRCALAATVTVSVLVSAAQAPDPGQASIAAKRAEAARLRSAVAAESARISATANGIADAQRRVAALDARARQRTAQTVDAQNRLVVARARLTALQKAAARADRLLAANLVATYKAGEPQILTVVLDAHGFADLLERVRFYHRVSVTNAHILDDTRRARRRVARQTVRLDALRRRFSALAREAIVDRDRADVIRNALLRRQAGQLERRTAATSRLVAVRASIAQIERRQAIAAAAARRAATAAAQAPVTQPASSGAPSPGGSGGSGGSAPASGDVSGVIARVVAAANQIATTPYVWGGGHGGSGSGGYDCSGSISYALAAGGLLSSPLTSGAFMSWGDPGPGRHITVYANAGHAFMIVDGRRFDTSALSGGGTRWTSAGRGTAGFVARHPPGY